MAHASYDMCSRDYWYCCWRLSVHDCGTVWTNFVRLVHCPRRRNNRADRLVFFGYTWLYLCSDRLCGWRSHRSFVDGFICSTGRARHLVVAIAICNHFRTRVFRLAPCAGILGGIKLG